MSGALQEVTSPKPFRLLRTPSPPPKPLFFCRQEEDRLAREADLLDEKEDMLKQRAVELNREAKKLAREKESLARKTKQKALSSRGWSSPPTRRNHEEEDYGYDYIGVSEYEVESKAMLCYWCGIELERGEGVGLIDTGRQDGLVYCLACYAEHSDVIDEFMG